ncbi:FHA domain-containing protein [Kitasatospora sp. SolWspMP-SS2h]|uniref:FHA domain-containing protein n=1 Tax=Kitasatospora sp. SolWspMP-SS2h TaxID=1305729 RepID=UPI000DB91DEE|nr:FHA domain-containing protein [Kitasatospora sp. SolWspMP-SS2h]RAJ44267.1 FHA domain-containing protein [Kitasatospora sp. SolWspMP-SS2h]
MPICPRGHESQAEDWCDYCGFPMTPPPGLAIPGFPNGPAQPGAQGQPGGGQGQPAGGQHRPGGPAAPPSAPPAYTSSGYPPVGPGSTPPSGTPAGGGGYFEPRRTQTPPAGTPTGPAAGAPGAPGAPGPYGAPPPPPATTGLVTCPICRSPQTGRYCEECGYDYNLATSARPPGTAPAPQPQQHHQQQQQGYGFPPPAAAPPAPPAGFDPPAPPQSPYERPQQQPQRHQQPYEQQQRAPYEQPHAQQQSPQPPQSPYERPQQQHQQPQQHAPQQHQSPSPYERPGYPGAQAAQAAASAPSAPSFDKPSAAGFPDVDYERTGPVYAEPSAPPAGHRSQPGPDSGTSFRLTPPGQPGGAPQQRSTWFAVVAHDHDYFTDMMTRSGPEAAGLYFPQYTSERRIPLTGRGQLRIGRRSQQRGTVPEIDLSVAPEDPGASHHHALLAEQPDGSWVVVDQDSTNGTTMNGSPDTLPPHTAIPLNDGDRIHVGAWTTITVHLA